MVSAMQLMQLHMLARCGGVQRWISSFKRERMLHRLTVSLKTVTSINMSVH